MCAAFNDSLKHTAERSPPSSFTELLMLSKLQQRVVDCSNYKVSCVRALWLPLSPVSVTHAAHCSFVVWIFCKVEMEVTGGVFAFY